MKFSTLGSSHGFSNHENETVHSLSNLSFEMTVRLIDFDGSDIVERKETEAIVGDFLLFCLGFFMLISQFQAPSHFLMAYLEDYKMDPHSATPLLTFSIFDDYSSKDIYLVRCDILNKNIGMNEGQKVVESILENYRREDDYSVVKMFNEHPDDFDVDDFISRMNDRWKRDA